MGEMNLRRLYMRFHVYMFNKTYYGMRNQHKMKKKMV